jgi:ABC-type Fe3+ transport system substrate-binding protein
MSCKRCLLALQAGAEALQELLRECPEQLPADVPWASRQAELAELAERLLVEREARVQRIFDQRRQQQ